MQSSLIQAAVGNSNPDWDSFVGSHEGGSFYHRYGWKPLLERQFGHECVYLESRTGGELNGVLPLVLTRSMIFGRILCSMPFVNYGGPLAGNPAIAGDLIEIAMDHARRSGVDYLEVRSASPLDIDLPASMQKVSMTLELEADPEKVWGRFSSKHRNSIRRVYKDGCEIRSGGAELLEEFYGVMQQSWRDLGTPLYSPSFFEAVVEAFSAETRIFVCHREGIPIAAAFNGHSATTVEGMWAGVTPVGRQLNANYALYWEMIKDACLRGFTRYHLGRSTAGSGAEQFKKKWNAEPAQLYWYHYRPDGRSVPLLNVQNPKYRLAISAWRRMPLWATRLIGPPLARAIP